MAFFETLPQRTPLLDRERFTHPDERRGRQAAAGRVVARPSVGHSVSRNANQEIREPCRGQRPGGQWNQELEGPLFPGIDRQRRDELHRTHSKLRVHGSQLPDARCPGEVLDLYSERQESHRRDVLVIVDDPHLDATVRLETWTRQHALSATSAAGQDPRQRQDRQPPHTLAALSTSGAGLSCFGTAASTAPTTSTGVFPARRAV